MIIKNYRYRLYPNKEQRVLLGKHFGACRWVYNYALENKIKYYTKYKKSLSYFRITKHLTVLKKKEKAKWLNELCAQSLQQPIISLDRAYAGFFKEGKGFPKFKSKKNSKQSVTFTQKSYVDFENNKIQVSKFKEGIKCKLHRTFDGKIKKITITKTLTNKYYASVLFEENICLPKKPKLNVKKAVGIDLGIKSLLVMSNNQKFDNPKFLTKSFKKISKSQRRLSRKKTGGKNWEKQKLIIAKQYEKVTNQRNDFLNKISKQLIDDNQADTYCFEKLDSMNMIKNKILVNHIQDTGWWTFIRFMKYKADWYGKNILQIGRFEPSSKTCNKCGEINNKLTLADRKWQCECSAKLDRDFNAACNIRDFAFDKQNKIGRGTSESTLGEMCH